MGTSINLIDLLQSLDNYVLLKLWPGYPDVRPGTELDLLVLDKFDSSEKLKSYLEDHVDGIEFHIRVTDTNSQFHLDIIKGNKIEIRLDLIDNFDIFTRFSVKQSLITEVFMNRDNLDIQNAKIFVPSNEHDLLLRYFEFIEYFEQPPEKISHLDFIANTADENTKKDLIFNAHRYINFRRKEWPGDVPVKVSVKNKIRRNGIYFVSVGKKILKPIWTAFKKRIAD